MPRIGLGGAKWVFAAAALLSLLLAAPAVAAPRLGWTATPSPFALSITSNGAPLVSESTLSGGPGGHLSYRLADGSFHGLTQLTSSTSSSTTATYRVATDEPGRTAVVTARRTANGVRVSFVLQPSTGVVATFESFAARAGEHFLGGGERPGTLDLTGQALAVKVSYACQNVAPAPFYLSSAGYGISLLTTSIASLGFPGSVSSSACPGGAEPRCPLADALAVVQLCAKTSSLAYDVYAGTPTQIVSDYSASIGRPELPATSQFELIKWRDIVAGPTELYDDADKLRALHVPIGWVLLDNPWETGFCYGTMTFDPKFGDPKALISSLHQRGVKLMLWISPLVRLQGCPPSSQYSQSEVFGTGGKAVTIDLSNPKTAATFSGDVQSLIQLGADGFKADRGDEIDLEPETLAGGPGVALQNLYPLLYARAVAAAIKAAGRPADFPTLFRAGAPGSAAVVPGFWGGDQAGSFFGLQQAIRDGLSAGIAGYSTWGSDTGGYGATESGEVLARWAQFSAVSPVFEIGGTGKNSTFWDFGSRTVDAVRRAAVLHYELFPYLYAFAGAAHATGVPVLRPLALAYPGDAQAWKQDLEVLVGPDLLAVPVTSAAPAGAQGTAAAPVYLPKDTWVDLATGASIRGGGAPFTRTTPLNELPLYLRAGAAIPFAARTPSIWPRAWPTDALKVPGRGGWLYAPAAGHARAATADFGTFAATTSGRTVRLRLTHAPRETQVLVATATAPSSVRVGGSVLPRASSVAALRRATQGWTLTRDPFRAIVVKLAPHAGAASVELVLRQPA